MKNTGKLTLVFLSCAAAPVMAQTIGDPPQIAAASVPQCAVTNFDQARNAFTVLRPAPDAVNQQCFFTVMPKDQGSMGTVLPVLSEYPAPRLMEGQYLITLSGGGGGGGGGNREGGGGGGAGALPVQVTQYLPPGIYRMTIGAGGAGGAGCQTAQNGGLGTDGNPTGLSEAYTGNVLAGFPRAEYWAGSTRLNYNVAAADASPTTGARSANEVAVADVSNGKGAPAMGGQSTGGDGGRLTPVSAAKAADGGMLKEIAYPGLPGKGGDGYLPSGSQLALAGGGGGGAGYGQGGDGQPAGPAPMKAALSGELGGGGGGGAGGPNLCGAGAAGGHGFIAIKPM